MILSLTAAEMLGREGSLENSFKVFLKVRIGLLGFSLQRKTQQQHRVHHHSYCDIVFYKLQQDALISL